MNGKSVPISTFPVTDILKCASHKAQTKTKNASDISCIGTDG